MRGANSEPRKASRLCLVQSQKKKCTEPTNYLWRVESSATAGVPPHLEYSVGNLQKGMMETHVLLNTPGTKYASAA